MPNLSVIIFAVIWFGSRFVLGEMDASFSSKELKAIEQLREQVAPQLYRDFMKDDHYLIKFLRSRELNVNDAKAMLLKALQWRKEHKIDTIRQENFDKVAKLLPYQFGTFDYDGFPVGALRVGEWKSRRIILAGKSEEAIRYIHSLLEFVAESTRNVSKATGNNITEANIIVDLSGFNLREHACLLCIPIYIELFITYENYYPYAFRTLTAINTPRIFQSVEDIIRPILSKRTSSILALYGFDKNEWMSALLKFIPKDQIPKYFSTYRR